MRCPKCGYITFDHLQTCLKCKKNVAKAAAQVEGTTYNVAAPSFLRFQTENSTPLEEESTEIRFNGSEEEFIDRDLDVLVDTGQDEGEDFETSFDDDIGTLEGLAEDENFEIALDGGDDEDGIDLGQFEDAFEEEEATFPDDEIQLDVPEELADISDLSAPAMESEAPALQSEAPALEGGLEDLDIEGLQDSVVETTEQVEEELEGFSLNLDLDDLDSDFSLLSPEENTSQSEDPVDIGELSLGDLGLTDSAENKAPAKAEKTAGAIDMNGDLDFDLDLGGLSLTED